MKKLFVIIVVLLLLTGCMPQPQISTQQPTTEPTQNNDPVVAETAPTQAQTEPPTEPEPEILQQPMIAVSLPVSVQTLNNSSEQPVYHSSRQSMQLTIRDPEVADVIILDFLNRVDSYTEAEDAIRQAAENADTSDAYWSEYFYNVIYEPMRLDHNVLSLYGSIVSYSGETHPQQICTAANYSTITGDVLTLGSILYHIDAKDDLAQLVIESLDLIAEEKYLLDGYDDVIRKRFNRDESFDEDWYFSTTGLCFYFAPYEIAPYSSGVIIAEIPYGKLTGIIADEFFPAEEDYCEGTMEAITMDAANTDSFTQISEVTVDNDGQMYFLYTAKSVRNVQLHKTISGAGELAYSQDCTIFRTYTLTPGDAIMIKISPQTDASALYLTYESNGTTQSIALSELLDA